MNCQYCGKIFRRDYNLRRHEDEHCSDRDNDGRECSPPKKSRDADEASISSNESMGTHASHGDDNDQRGSVQGVGSVQRDLARSSWRVMTKAKRKRTPSHKFYLHSERN